MSSVILDRWDGTRVPNKHVMVTAPRCQVLITRRTFQATNLWTRANHMVIHNHYQSWNLCADFIIYFTAFINNRHCLVIQNLRIQGSTNIFMKLNTHVHHITLHTETTKTDQGQKHSVNSTWMLPLTKHCDMFDLCKHLPCFFFFCLMNWWNG
jgi:hypothetical protein